MDEMERIAVQLTLALEAARAGTWEWEFSTGEITWSPETHRIFGDPAIAYPPTFHSFIDRVHGLDRKRVESTLACASSSGSACEMEFRIVGFDAVERWIRAQGTVCADREPRRMIGVFLDVTSRHRAAQESHDLRGRLVNAQEHERHRLSRELHDGVGQQLAVLSAELTALREALAGSPMLERVRRLVTDVEQLGAELHRVSQDLSPISLERVGLAASIRRICAELSDAYPIRIHLELGQLSPQINHDAALCLYRIAQEALRNVVKHSHAAATIVRLEARPDEIVLDVIDDGHGFDPAAANELDGLGLVSMRERARLVGGNVTLVTNPGQGTRVQACIPFAGSPLRKLTFRNASTGRLACDQDANRPVLRES